MPDDTRHFKRWMVETTYEVLRRLSKTRTPGATKSWKNYCKEQFDTIGLTYEFSWFMLNAADMHKKGETALIAYALAVIEETGW